MTQINSTSENAKVLQSNAHVDYVKDAREKLRKELFENFKNIPNRLQLAGTVNEVDYYNDSAAVNVNDTVISIGLLGSKIVLVIGPYSKNADYNSIREVAKGRVDAIICFGDQRERTIEFFIKENWLLINAEDLDEAVYFSSLYAKPENKVLFSSACTSFPAFSSVQDRADVFLNAINKIQIR